MAGFNAQTESLHWIYGLPRGGGPGPNGLTLGHLADLVERMSLDVSRAADWVPRVPAVLPSLLRSLRDDNHSAHDLAALLEQDVTLLAEALKAANSAQHAHDSPITDTADAVRLLGSHGLRLVIARVAFRPVLGADAGALTQAGAGRVWALADACAQASRDLAPARGVDPFEAFLSGLAAHVGLLVSLRMADRAAHLARPDPHGLGPRRVLLDDPTAAANQHQTAQDLMHLVALLSHRVAARWELPDNVVGTLTGLCDPLARARWSSACELLEVAQETARLLVLADADWLPAPRPDCWSHLPADAQDWLARQRSTPSHSSTSEPA
jgi:HD-like signal output (HDOD) protein